MEMSASPGGGRGPLDTQRFREVTDGDPDLIRELNSAFVEDTTKRIAALRGALDAGDAPQVKDHAHTVKGTSGNIGAIGMQAIALELEDLAKAGALDGAPAVLARLEAEFLLVRGALHAEATGASAS